MISLIVAMDKERCIGKNGSLPWHLRADLQRLKDITTGNAIIMGRATFESIGKALPNRQNIVLTSDKNFSFPGVEVANSLQEAFGLVEDGREAIVFGGASVYEAALPQVAVDIVTPKVELCEVETFSMIKPDVVVISQSTKAHDRRNSC
ncbi:MAG: dihydrofolate reductase [Candidatus Paceibacterota bacterium]